jgi:hypothetical protein
MIRDIYGDTKFEQDLLNDVDIMNLVIDEVFAKNLYASMCNVIWKKGSEEFSSSWRYAAGVVANMRNVKANLNEDYLDFYLSGSEGTVFVDVKDVLGRLGWIPASYGS